MLSNHPRIRVGIYVAAVAAQIASFFVTLYSADLAQAFVSTSQVLAAVAGVTALTNLTPVVGENIGFSDPNTGFRDQ